MSLVRAGLGGRAALFGLWVVSACLAVAGCTTDQGPRVIRDSDASVEFDAPVADGPQLRVDAPASCSTATPANKPLGQACTCASDCASGFCVDGVCCNTTCEGICRACNIASSAGTCTPLAAGARPVVANQCATDPVASCGRDGTCDGTGACRKYPDGTECKGGSCNGASVAGAMVCQSGACKAGPVTQCFPFSCDSATGKCFTTCANASQCDNRTCNGGSCGVKPLGATCTAGPECESGFCADGVCCNVACTGACVSCALPGKMGECQPVAVNLPDPHGVCKMELRETCGQSGLCNGQGGCSKYVAGTICKAASCSGGSQIPASTCNGNGTCLLGSAISCFPYICADGMCKATCDSGTDCVPGNVCMKVGNVGSCGKKGLGQACTGAADCKSGFCVDKVCCDQACGETCAYCAFPNSLGRCTTVPAGVVDQRAVCVDKGPASCGTDGKCNGARACSTYATGTVCKSGTCDPATNKVTSDGVCRNGACVSPAPVACTPYKCNGSRCGTSCSTKEQCQGANSCQDGSCGKKPSGAICSKANECASGFCSQGVCCGTNCTASCFSCSLPGSAGTCAAVPSGGLDPAGACMDQGPASCGNDGVCNGAGACRKYASGTVCVAARCMAGTYTSESTCNGSGTCTLGSQRPCSPFVCNAGGTACFGSCSDDTQCISTRKCEMGQCGLKDNGAACNAGDECKSNFCVDGYCCNSACGELCKTCALPGALGMCSNLPSGTPDNAGGCPAAAESTCGNDGACNGSGGCRKWGINTVCRGGSCPSGATTWTKPATCDGNGTCPAGATQSCGSFKCDPATMMCKMTCTSDADCNGKGCDTATGSCGKSLAGASCANGTECSSGFCVDGTCCTTASCGTCQSCGNLSGVCANVPDGDADPDTCTDNGCASTGKCDGAGACKKTSAGTFCGMTCDGTNSGVTIKTCDGNGTCSGTGNTMSCNGFVCASDSCATTCDSATNAGCVAGKVCVSNTCQDPVVEPDDQDGGI